MDELITDQIEWLLTANSGTLRMGRSIMTLAGFLSDGSLPEQIDRQLADLSRQVMLQELLDSLIQSLNTILRTYGVVSHRLKNCCRSATSSLTCRSKSNSMKSLIVIRNRKQEPGEQDIDSSASDSMHILLWLEGRNQGWRKPLAGRPYKDW